MATRVAVKFETEKLDDSNYATWLMQIMLILMKEGTWAYVECSKTKDSFIQSEKHQTSEEREKRELEWDAMMNEAYTSIMMTLSLDILWEFSHYRDPRILMIEIKAKYKHSAGGTSQYLRRQMANTKLIRYGNVTVYTKRLSQLVADILHFGGEIQDEEIIHFITAGLPDDWSDISRVIRSRADLKWDSVVHQLRCYETNLRLKLGLEPDADMFVGGVLVRGIKNTTTGPVGDQNPGRLAYCTHCWLPGHSTAMCWALYRDTVRGEPGLKAGQRTPIKRVRFALSEIRETMPDTESTNIPPRTTKSVQPSASDFWNLVPDL